MLSQRFESFISQRLEEPLTFDPYARIRESAYRASIEIEKRYFRTELCQSTCSIIRHLHQWMSILVGKCSFSLT